MAELKLGTAFIDVIPKVNTGAAAAAQAQAGGMLKGLSAAAGSAGVAIGAAVAAGVVVAGAALFKLGENVNDAYRQIRIGTGATGEVLDGLEASFRKVGGSVASSFTDSSKAVADLYSRTGLTGKALEDLSVTELKLARLTKQDLGETIQSTTRLFGDWGISVEDQTKTLDYLFKVSQQTGIGVNSLSDQLVKFGAPMRQLGFTFEQSAALIGKFEKEGVNAGLVLGSMRIALGKMSKAGEPVQETFRRVTDEIKNAGSTSEANAKALELFGARAGPDMAAAIREGRFEIDDLEASLAASTDTIAKASSETSTLGGKFALLKNKIGLALAPLASSFYDGVNKLAGFLLPKLADGIAIAAGGIEKFASLIQDVGGTVIRTLIDGWNGGDDRSGILGYLQRVGEIAHDVWTFIVDTAIPAIQRFGGDAWNEFLEILDTVKLGVAGFLAAFENGDVTSDGFVGFLERAGAAAKTLKELVVDNLGKVIDSLTNGFNGGDDGGIRIFTDLGQAARTVVDYFEQKVVPFFNTEIAPLWDDFQRGADIVRENFGPVMREVFGWLGDHLPVVAAALGAIFAPIPTLIVGFGILYQRSELLRDIIEKIVGALQPFIAQAVELGGELIGNWVDRMQALWEILDGIVHLNFGQVVDGVKNFFGSFISDATSIIGNLGPALLDLFRNLGLGELIGKAFTEGIPALAGILFEGLQTVLKNIPSWLLNILDGMWIAAGTVFGDFLPKAIEFASPLVQKAIKGLFDFIADLPAIVGRLIAKYGPTVGKVIIGGLLLSLKVLVYEFPKWIVTEMIPAIVDAIITHGPDVLATFADLVGKIPGVLLTILSALGGIVLTILEGVAHVINTWLGGLPGMLLGLGVTILSSLGQAIAYLVTNAPGLFLDFLAFWATLPFKILGALGDLGLFLWDNVFVPAFAWLVDNLPGGIAALLEFFVGLPGLIWGALGDLGRFLYDNAFEPAAVWIYDHTIGKFGELIDWFSTLPGLLRDAAGDVFGWLSDSLRSAINGIIGLWNGIRFPDFSIGPYEIPTSPWTSQSVGPFSFGGVDFPDIPLLEHGGTAMRRGMGIVGDAGPELLAMPRGASILPLDVAAMLAEAGAAAAGNGSGDSYVFPTQDGPTAQELLDYVELMTGKKLTARNDQ